MSDVGYVAAAWSTTAVVLAAYLTRITLRTRQARRSLPSDDPRR